MGDQLLRHLFAGETAHVLFLTLIHSLWQGIVFAFLTAIILMSTKRSATALRYKLLCCVLLLFIITTAGTFCYEAFSGVNHIAATGVPVAAFPGVIAISTHSKGAVETLISLVQPYEAWIVLAWFTVITIKCLGLITGLREVYTLKHHGVFDAGQYWNERLQALAENSGIKKQIVLLKSSLAKVPMVVGYVKPVILFPVAAFTALAPEEIEAILVHELAHIRRKDYLMNIFQRIAEIIFFFNPAVLWISSLIKEERENCCDDIAVRQTKNKRQFIRALVSFQEYNSSGYVTSFSGKKNASLNRIKRIITNNNKTLSSMEKTFLATGIVVTAFAALAFSHRQPLLFKNGPGWHTASLAFAGDKTDSIPQTGNDSESNNSVSTTPEGNESTSVINTTMDGKQYRLIEKNGKVTELYVDNVRVPGNKIADYSDVIKKLNENMEKAKKEQKEAMKAQKDALEAQKKAIDADKLAMAEQEKNSKRELDAQMMELKDEIAASGLQNDSAAAAQLEALKAQSADLRQKSLAMNDVIKKEMVKKLDALKDEQREQKELMKDQADKMEKEREVMIKEKVEMHEEMMKQQKMMRDELNKQMIKENAEKAEINEQLKKQVEELKQENEKLRQQLHQNQKGDSIRVIAPNQ